jgi:hypothetical protein
LENTNNQVSDPGRNQGRDTYAKGTQRDHTKKQVFHDGKKKLKRLKKNGKTKECIAGHQIKQWIEEMHTYQQKHLIVDQTWFRISKGNRWWPTMGIYDVQNFIKYDCPTCRERFHNLASLFMVHVQPFEDWRAPFIEYFTHGKLLSILAILEEQIKTRQLSELFFLDDGKLMRVSISGNIHECIAGDIIEEIISEAHEQEGVHFNLSST